MHKNTLWDVMKRLILSLVILILLSTVFLNSSLAGGVEPLPGLQKALTDIRSLYKGKEPAFLADKEYQVQKYYYTIQSKTQRLEILEEVKEHFEKAVTKSEEKFDSGEEDVTQSAITKLKLGLAGTLNDIIELDSDIKVARLLLAGMFKEGYSADAEMSNSDIEPVDFNFNNYETWLKESGLGTVKVSNELQISSHKLKLKTDRKSVV